MTNRNRMTLIRRLKTRISVLEQKMEHLFPQRSGNEKAQMTKIDITHNLFKLIAENTSDGILIANSDSTIEYVSSAYSKQLGYEDDEEIGRTAEDIYNIIHPDDRDLLFAKIYDAIGKKKSDLIYSFRARHKLGHYIWREDHAKFNYDDEGNHINSFVIARDITERVLLDEQLAAMQKVLREAPVSIVITDTDAKILYANPYFSEITGYSFDELLYQSTSILRSGYHPDEYYKKLWDKISAGNSWEGIFCNKKKDGTLYWERSIIIPVKNKTKEITNYIAIKTDISQQREQEFLLSQRKHEYDAINQSIPLISWKFKLDKNRNIISKYVSNFVNDLIDITEDQVRNDFNQYLKHVLPEYREGLINSIYNRFDNPNTNISYEYQLKATNGELHWLASTGFAVFEEGDLVSYGSTIDITERRKLEQSLIKANFRMEVAADSAGIGIWELQTKNNQLIWDDWMFKLYDLPKEEFDGTINSWKKNVYEEDIDAALNNVQQALEGKKEFNTEFRVRFNDGSLRYLKAFGKVIRDQNNEPEYMIGVNYDITHIKQYESELQNLNNHLEKMVKTRTNELESVLDELMQENEYKNEALDKLSEANAAKHKYISILAHDIKNPLTAILTSTELLHLFINKGTIDKLPKHINRISDSSKQILGLVEMVLLWNKSQNETIKYEPTNIYLQQIIDTVIMFSNLSITQKSMDIVVDIPQNLQIVADREMIETILRNLISNAVKFSNPTSTINIYAKEMDKDIVISVSDQGVGIEQDRIATIFEPNDSNHTLGTLGEKGTGLGLPLCKEFILRHNGSIWAESVPNVGTTLFISLPKQV